MNLFLRQLVDGLASTPTERRITTAPWASAATAVAPRAFVLWLAAEVARPPQAVTRSGLLLPHLVTWFWFSERFPRHRKSQTQHQPYEQTQHEECRQR